jgi:hypothetical protein
MQSTLKDKPKTHPEMLPQSPALEVSVDVPGKVKPGTIKTDPLRRDQTGFQHARGERPAIAGPSPFPQGKEQSGVTRVFVLSKDGTPLMPCHAARARELLTKGKLSSCALPVCDQIEVQPKRTKNPTCSHQTGSGR